MTKKQFRGLFLRALDAAAENAEAKLARPVPRSFMIELHAPTALGRMMSVDDAVEQLYLGDDRFFRIIDVAITGLSPQASVAFVRVSGHPPSEFGQTWNSSGLGPFKQIIADKIAEAAAGAG